MFCKPPGDLDMQNDILVLIPTKVFAINVCCLNI